MTENEIAGQDCDAQIPPMEILASCIAAVIYGVCVPPVILLIFLVFPPWLSWIAIGLLMHYDVSLLAALAWWYISAGALAAVLGAIAHLWDDDDEDEQ